ncbi:ribonuclease catalytic domain-containing protein [Sutterella sp.]|uniref:ribonuclease catalytic domain-containing protein n=1 Tax=Sutterella sp. TaxID=1981025 RepID=UPI0026E0E2C2|nr:RNB domain-containing ribonuclease [Sutterella sp.]MDO5531840.1 RNB domain-containing ribonuclease [Sutterella sp.]
MNLYFEEDGAFKAGTVLGQAGSAYQVELTTGRRTKIKASHVFFSFESPSAAELIARIPEAAAELDPAFLWEAAPEGEFGAADLAAEYWGDSAGPVEKAALLVTLHANPVYFYRKGRGVYRKAPADILAKALEALERKRRQEEQKKAWTAEMVAGKLPEPLARQALALLVTPDRNSIEWKALSDAAAETRQTPLRLMLALGGIASPWRWHVDSFYALNFPRGRGFPDNLPEPPQTDWAELPLADDVDAFSIDDSETTEIDDATSVKHLDGGITRVGIHIAAPALMIERGSPLDAVAQARMSTVYAPGLKTTMLPENWVAAASLDEGRVVPCLSLYAWVKDDTFSVERTETRLERIRMSANLRYDKIDSLVTEEAIEANTLDIPYAHEISWLWHFAKHLQHGREEVRGRPEPVGRVDWFFALEGEGEDAKIHVKGRRRGAPLDLLVAEMMIFANSTWGLWLEEHSTPGIYRSQRMGRVRMSTSPGPHDGLGVLRYAWSTSPLRRYVDLVNQRQMITALRGEPPAYARNDVDLFAIVSQFENIHALYGDFQTRMERYWSLRWIIQEGLTSIEAIIVKGDLVRIDGLPFMQRVPGLPEDLPRGRKVELRILGCDLVDLVMDAQLVRVLDESLTPEEEEALEEELNQELEEAAPAETPETPEGAEAAEAAEGAPAADAAPVGSAG